MLSPTDLSALLHATHTSPHSVLGMHPVTKGSSRGVVVRAFLRQAAECAVVDHATDERWPMTRIADDGVYEVFIAGRREVFRYQLRVKTPAGETRRFFDPYSLSAHARRPGPVPVQRGQRAPDLREARRAPPDDRRGGRRGVRGVGAGGEAGFARGQFQPLGRTVSPDAAARLVRRVGALRPGDRGGRAVQVRRARQQRPGAVEDRSVRHLLRGAAEQRVDRVRHRQVPVERRRVARAAPGRRDESRPPDVGL